MMHLIDIDCLSNGVGKKAYGGRLDAYSFFETTCEKWFDEFAEEVISAVGKYYYPVYRIADGELRFLFGPRINWKNKPFRSLLSFVKYKLFKAKWKTSWGEHYDTDKIKELRNILIKDIAQIASYGKLAIYWNENGLNAFTEYNKVLVNAFRGIGIQVNTNNYIPFHFGQAFIAKYVKSILINKNLFIVSGIDKDEFIRLKSNMESMGVRNCYLHKCSSTAALLDTYSKIKPLVKPDIVFVSAGIGAARVLSELRHLNCPIIDIGGYIHVLSGKLNKVHAGFFINPKLN